MHLSAAGRMLAAAAMLAAVTACARSGPVAPPHTPTPALPSPLAKAEPVQPDPMVGAVFLGDGTTHSCSGAVLDSTGGDLILTAAHCIADGVDASFVAGFNNDAPPDGVWHVDAVYLDPRWVLNQDPMADFAIARVSRDSGGTIQGQAGGGLRLGSAPVSGTVVTVTGYPMGDGGGPVGCRGVTAKATKGFPSLPCEGIVGGFSGAPWVTGSTITGLVGGLDGGGCQDESSYSPPFDGAITALLARAEAGGPPDDVPTVFDDDCD